jgi:branched-chain amino acid transport system substrate-binding protein
MKLLKWGRFAGALSIAALSVATLSSVTNASASSSKVKTVNIGMITSITGAYSVYGIPFQQGATFGVYQINKTGFVVKGQKYKFKLTSENDNTSPATAVQKAIGLIDDQHIIAMIGPIGAQGPGAEQITNAHHVIMFSSSSAVTATAGAAGGNPYVFSTDGDPSKAGDFVFNAIKTFVPGATSVALLAPQDDTDAANEPLYAAIAQADGLKFYNASYPVGSTDLSSVMTTLIAEKPSVIIMGDDTVDMGVEAPQLATAGLPASTVVLGYAEAISECGVIQTSLPNNSCIADPLVGADLSSNSLDPFDKTWVREFEAWTKTPSLSPFIQATTWTYDFPSMLVAAMKKAGTVTNTAAIVKALHEVTITGMIGKIQYNSQNGLESPLAFTLVTPAGQETTKEIASS